MVGVLMTMVCGHSEQQKGIARVEQHTRVTAQGRHNTATSNVSRPTLHDLATAHSNGHGHEPVYSNGNGNGHAHSNGNNSGKNRILEHTGLRPEHVIPLDADELKDF